MAVPEFPQVKPKQEKVDRLQQFPGQIKMNSVNFKRNLLTE